MIKLKFKCIEASEDGDYYQLHFRDAGESEVEGLPYFIIQRGFEDEDDDNDDPFFIETNDDSSIGHALIVKVALTPGSLYLQTRRHPWREILIQFETSPLKYSKQRFSRTLYGHRQLTLAL
jgi:hypothetical protein